MTTADSETTSTRPYLIRALHEWCTDNGLTPHLAVSVDETVQVPQEFVKQGEIVLNVSFDATSVSILGDELIEFKGRFSGTPREIRVPVRQVMAIYARENGQGMSFPISAEKSDISKSELANRPVDKSARALTAKGKEKGTANLASVNSVSDQSSSTIPESTGSPETRGPRPTLTRIK